MERFVLKLPARIALTDDLVSQEETEFTTTNICAGGAYLLTDRPLLVGTTIHMVMRLPLDNIFAEQGRQSQIKLKGRVLRNDTKGMAVLFDGRYQISPLT